MAKLSNGEAHWDEFCDWCGENEIGDPRLSEDADWALWFECWKAALAAREAADRGD